MFIDREIGQEYGLSLSLTPFADVIIIHKKSSLFIRQNSQEGLKLNKVMREKRIPQRYVTRESMFLVINFYMNCHYYMRDADFDEDDITKEQIVILYTKISDNDFDFDEYDNDILETTREAYCIFEEN